MPLGSCNLFEAGIPEFEAGIPVKVWMQQPGQLRGGHLEHAAHTSALPPGPWQTTLHHMKPRTLPLQCGFSHSMIHLVSSRDFLSFQYRCLPSLLIQLYLLLDRGKRCPSNSRKRSSVKVWIQLPFSLDSASILLGDYRWPCSTLQRLGISGDDLCMLQRLMQPL